MPLPDRGAATFKYTGNSEDWAFSNTSIRDLVVFLSTRESGVIFDSTGLTGRYNFELSGSGDESGSGGSLAVAWNFKALGLELKKTKVETTTLVIDHIEQPTEN